MFVVYFVKVTRDSMNRKIIKFEKEKKRIKNVKNGSEIMSNKYSG